MVWLQYQAEIYYNLGSIYRTHEYNKVDKVRAKEYFGLACDVGNQKGCDEYREINEQIAVTKKVHTIEIDKLTWKSKPRIDPVVLDRYIYKLDTDTVVVSIIFQTDTSGKIISASIAKSSGVSALDNYLIRRVREARLQPVYKIGVAVSVKSTLNLTLSKPDAENYVEPKEEVNVMPTPKVDVNQLQTNASIAEKAVKPVSKSFIDSTAIADKGSANDEYVVRHPTGKRSTYVVQAGDTLAEIASANSLNWRDIAEWNRIDPNAPLYVGATLYLYDAKPVVAATKRPETYTVQAGDTLIGVAQQFGLTVKQLADYNGLSITSNLLQGQKLSLIAP